VVRRKSINFWIGGLKCFRNLELLLALGKSAVPPYNWNNKCELGHAKNLFYSGHVVAETNTRQAALALSHLLTQFVNTCQFYQNAERMSS
jgi:hypothetical protein